MWDLQAKDPGFPVYFLIKGSSCTKKDVKKVVSRIYALLSVIRQQMSAFDPFRGGWGGWAMSAFLPFFYMRASLTRTAGKIFVAKHCHGLSIFPASDFMLFLSEPPEPEWQI